MTSDSALQQLADAFTSLEPHLRESGPDEEVLAAITGTGVQVVRGAEHSAITRGRPGKFQTVAATSDVPLAVDSIQYALGYGPCIDVRGR
jgi:hypothetical protein